MTICTVIVPTYNRPHLLKRALTSALAGLPVDGEIVVVDDGSEVPASDVAKDINDPRLHIIRNDLPMGGGGSSARNRGVQHATGNVLFFLDDDDELLPGYIEQVLSTGVNKGADFGFAARKFARDSKSAAAGCDIEKRGLPNGFVPLETSFGRRTFPFSAGFWIKREVYDSVGPISETLHTNSDTEYCCRLYSSKFCGWYSTQPAVIVHQPPPPSTEQMTSVTHRTRAEDRAEAFKAIAQVHSDFMRVDAGASDFVHARWIKHALRAGRPNEALEALSCVPQRQKRLKLACLYVALRASIILSRTKK